MTMGEKIRQLRKENHLTQEALGMKLEPRLNRAAINKWETGKVENIKRSYIEQMSKIFGIKPSDLMCFQEQNLKEDVILIEKIQSRFGSSAVRILDYFTKLNDQGQSKALESLDDLTNIEKYRNDEDV